VKFFIDNLYLFAIALVSGGLLLWPLIKRGGGSTSVTPAIATQLINQHNAIVVDLRDEAAFATGSVTGARHLPLASIAERGSELVRFKSRPVILVCESGQSSTRAMATLKTQGFEDVRVLAGGLAAWKQAGLPLVKANREPTRAAGKDAPRKSKNNRDRSRQQRSSTPAGVEAANEPALVDPAVPAPDAGGPPDRVKEVS
jgi:rhodanese-related sulfurtransferase